ncbi:MAG: hypothetical protein WDZ26_02655 [Nitriliruptoraceae bacterium]
MRPGPARGTTAQLDVAVTSDMSASPTSRTGRMLYGTRALVGHMTQVCQMIIEPHLEPGEEAIDMAVEVRHREPVAIGSRIGLEATVATVEPTRVTCEVMVRCDGRTVARGTIELEAVRTEDFRERIEGR